MVAEQDVIVIELLFLAVVALSLSGSLVALLLLLVKRIGGHRFSQTWHYYIWLVVVARLLIPFSLEINLVNSVLHFATPQAGVDSTGIISDDVPNNSTPALDVGQDFIPFDTPANPYDEQLPPPAAAGGYQWQVIVQYASYIWATVAVVLFVRKVASYIGLVREIRKNSRFSGDPEAAAHIDSLCKALKISPAPVLYISDNVPAPMLIGIIRQQIILPTDSIGRPDLKYVLHHELIHYRRFDILYKWLAQIAVSIHWFNPLVYLMRREISRSCELSCDEAVIRRAGEQERRHYGEAILSAIKPGKALAHTGISVSMSEDTKIIKERLDAIMRYKRKSTAVFLCSLLVAGVLMCGAAFTGAYAADTASTSPSAPSPTPVKSDAFDGSEYTPYLSYGVTVSSPNGKDVLYYNGERVRLLVDYKDNNAFHLFYVDREGTADLQATRNAQGNLSGISTLPSAQAQEFLRELEITESSSQSPAPSSAIPEGRISKEDLTTDLLDWMNSMDQRGEGIYIVRYEHRFVVYCNSIPGQYAWQPSYGSNTTVVLSDLGPNGDGYAVLNLPLSDNLTVSYNGASLSVSPESAMQLTSTRNVTNTYASYSSNTVYQVDQENKITIPLSLSSVDANGMVCIGQIPNIRGASRITYEADAAGGTGLYIGLSDEDKSVSNRTGWHLYVGTGNNQNSDQPNLIRQVWTDIGGSSHQGNYYVYVGTSETALQNVTGTITIEY